MSPDINERIERRPEPRITAADSLLLDRGTSEQEKRRDEKDRDRRRGERRPATSTPRAWRTPRGDEEEQGGAEREGLHPGTTAWRERTSSGHEKPSEGRTETEGRRRDRQKER